MAGSVQFCVVRFGLVETNPRYSIPYRGAQVIPAMPSPSTALMSAGGAAGSPLLPRQPVKAAAKRGTRKRKFTIGLDSMAARKRGRTKATWRAGGEKRALYHRVGM